MFYFRMLLLMYADDTVLFATSRKGLQDSLNAYADYCSTWKLDVNVDKTKIVCFDNRHQAEFMLNGETVETVSTFKYLGVVFDNKLTWSENTDEIIKKAHSRLFCMRKLSSFNVSKDILQMFYLSTIMSVLTFGCVCWGGNISQRDKSRMEKIIKKAAGVIGEQQESFDSVYQRRLTYKLHTILCDDTHPLRPELDSRLIDRSGRLRAPRVRTARYRQSFIPSAIHAFNSMKKR